MYIEIKAERVGVKLFCAVLVKIDGKKVYSYDCAKMGLWGRYMGRSFTEALSNMTDDFKRCRFGVVGNWRI